MIFSVHFSKADCQTAIGYWIHNGNGVANAYEFCKVISEYIRDFGRYHLKDHENEVTVKESRTADKIIERYYPKIPTFADMNVDGMINPQTNKNASTGTIWITNKSG